MKNKTKEIKYIIDDQPINVFTTWKRIKNYHLKTGENGSFELSVPLKTTNKKIFRYLEWNKSWIMEMLDFAKTSITIKTNLSLSSNETIYILGNLYDVEILHGVEKVITDYPKIYVYSTNIDNIELLNEEFSFWWNYNAVRIAHIIVESYMDETDLGKRIAFPEIGVFNRKRSWGGCLAKKNRIFINPKLFGLPFKLFEYTVLHELIHFLVPNHSKTFYEVLSSYMSDYKERKEEFKKYS